MILDHSLREGTNGRIAGPLPCKLARLDFKGVALKGHGAEALRSHRNQHGRGGKGYALGCCWSGEGSHEGHQGNASLHEAILLLPEQHATARQHGSLRWGTRPFVTVGQITKICEFAQVP